MNTSPSLSGLFSRARSLRRPVGVSLRIGSIPVLLGVLVACAGGGDDGHEGHDGHGTDGPAPQAEQPAEVEMIPVDGVPMSCPAGTQHQSAETSEGTEHWCDRDGVMDGPFLRFHNDGGKAATGAYINNLPDGPWIWWHANGKESEKGKYVKGKQTGSWTKWYETGERLEEGDYLQGRKQGTWTTWYESGRKKESGIYHNGMKSSTWTYYKDDEDNTEDRTEKFQNGQVVDKDKKAKNK